MTLYRLDDEITNSWNALVRAVNEACDADLPELTDPARWAKSDIEAVQEALAEAGICEFSEIGARWSQAKIDELVEAVQEGGCCCEEADKDDFPDRLEDYNNPPASFTGGPLFFTVSGTVYAFTIFDWAGWIMQAVEALEIEEVECVDDDPIEKRSHGRGWVGRQYLGWEMWFTGQKIREGAVVDGYLDLGEGEWQAAETCEEPNPTGGTPLGTDDPAWGFPYTFVDGGLSVQVHHLVDGQIGVLNLNNATNSGAIPYFIDGGYATSPFVGVWESGSPIPDNEKPFLRLICEVEDVD